MVRLITFSVWFCHRGYWLQASGERIMFSVQKWLLIYHPPNGDIEFWQRYDQFTRSELHVLPWIFFYAKGRMCILFSNKKAERTYKSMHVCIIMLHNIYIFEYYTYLDIMYTRYIMQCIFSIPHRDLTVSHTYFHLLIPKLRAGRCAVRTGGRKRCWWPKRWGLMSLMHPLPHMPLGSINSHYFHYFQGINSSTLS